MPAKKKKPIIAKFRSNTDIENENGDELEDESLVSDLEEPLTNKASNQPQETRPDSESQVPERNSAPALIQPSEIHAQLPRNHIPGLGNQVRAEQNTEMQELCKMVQQHQEILRKKAQKKKDKNEANSKMQLPIFKNEPQDNPAHWLWEIKSYFELAIPGAHEKAKMVTISASLQGRAKAWFNNLTDMEMEKYEKFMYAFDRDILQKRAKKTYTKVRQQESRETVEDYATFVKSLYRTGMPLNVIDTLRMRTFIEGVLLPIREELIDNEYKDFEDLLKDAIKWENLLNRGAVTRFGKRKIDYDTSEQVPKVQKIQFAPYSQSLHSYTKPSNKWIQSQNYGNHASQVAEDC